MTGWDKRFSRRSILNLMGGAAAAAFIVSCGKQEGGEGAPAGTGEEPKLNFYNWDTYIGETTLADFKTASGIEVKMDLFSSNDELFAKLRGGNPGYDVIMPSNDFVGRMIAANMLDALDKAAIPNAVNIAPDFQNVPFDLGRQYSIPYTWGTLGIGYRKSKVKGTPESWNVLFDSDAYKGRLSLIGEAGDLLRMTMKYLGYPLNETDPEKIEQATQLLIKQKPNVKVFHEDNGQDLLASGEVDLVIEYNGDIAQLMLEDDDIGYVIPKEGSQLFSDNMCIPKGAPHPKNAHAFINFLMDGKVGAEITKAIQYGTPNSAALALMDDAYKNNAAINPPSDVVARCEYAEYKGQETFELYEKALTRIKAA
jgi:spermidine/putrescine transport system substrate-binding protein